MSSYGTLDDPFGLSPVKKATGRLPIVNSPKLSRELVKVFDLGAYHVRKVVVSCEVGETPTVTVTRFVTAEEAERIGHMKVNDESDE